MGTVLRAWEESLRREVALKVMSPRWLHDPVARERFLQEALRGGAEASEHHHHSCGLPGRGTSVHCHGVCAGQIVGAGDRRGRAPSAPRAVGILRGVLAALEHAHGQGIVHRDVKPGNILLEEGTGLVKLVDFGVARGVADAVRNTMEGSVLGTPWYMSPEQASSVRGVDPRSDLFSVGVVLFEMLVGELPFPGQDLQDVLQRIRTEAAPNPCQLDSTVPRQLADILDRALQKDRGKRYQTAGEFAQALDAFLKTAKNATRPGDFAMPIGGLGIPVASAGSQSPEETWCSACGERIYSKLSVSGRCEVCQSPLCEMLEDSADAALQPARRTPRTPRTARRPHGAAKTRPPYRPRRSRRLSRGQNPRSRRLSQAACLRPRPSK